MNKSVILLCKNFKYDNNDKGDCKLDQVSQARVGGGLDDRLICEDFVPIPDEEAQTANYSPYKLCPKPPCVLWWMKSRAPHQYGLGFQSFNPYHSNGLIPLDFEQIFSYIFLNSTVLLLLREILFRGHIYSHRQYIFSFSHLIK